MINENCSADGGLIIFVAFSVKILLTGVTAFTIIFFVELSTEYRPELDTKLFILLFTNMANEFDEMSELVGKFNVTVRCALSAKTNVKVYAAIELITVLSKVTVNE